MKRRSRNQGGLIITEFLLGAALIMLPCALLMFVFPKYEETRQFALTTSRDISRTIALEGNANNVEQLVRETAANYGMDVNSVVVDTNRTDISGEPDAQEHQVVVWIQTSPTPGVVQRGGMVQVVVATRSPVGVIPGTGAIGAQVLSGRHTEFVDQYATFQVAG